jgi:hypothetical protein
MVSFVETHVTSIGYYPDYTTANSTCWAKDCSTLGPREAQAPMRLKISVVLVRVTLKLSLVSACRFPTT